MISSKSRASLLRGKHNKPQIVILAVLVLVLTCALTETAYRPLAAQGVDAQAGKIKEIAETKDSSAAQSKKSEELRRPSRWGEPTYVKIRIYVIDVDEVNSANQNFSASVYYEARWDNPILRHEGPGPVVRRTTDVWTPRLAIVNQQQAWSAFPSFVEVSPEGEVALRQKVWGWFSQPLDLKDFPIDQQTLTIHVAAAGLVEGDLKLVALEQAQGRQSGIHKGFSLPDFDVMSWKAESRPYIPFEGEVGTPGYIMEIQIKRRPSYFIWKVIFPLCLIVIMSWIPRWLDPKESSTSIGISTTAFLTLVAYLFAITVLLPKVSYLTRLDDFILLSTLLVFVGLIQTVTSTYLISIGHITQVERVNKLSRMAYPLLLLIVLAISFA
jgi:hypothetical protein